MAMLQLNATRSREQRKVGREKKKRRRKNEFDSEEANVFLGAAVSCLSMVAVGCCWLLLYEWKGLVGCWLF